MQVQSPFESEIAELMVSALNLRDINATDIDPEALLADGDLALDSIDVLELSQAISKKYSIQLESEENQWEEAFASLRSLAALVQSLKA